MESGRVPNKLLHYRRLAGLSQIQVAKLIGVPHSINISRWEKGLRTPSVRQLMQLSVVYETLPHHLYPELLKAIRQNQG